jgi:hypothetical protein
MQQEGVKTMAEVQVTLTDAERRCLLEVLELVLKDTRVEEHRTRTPSYREQILQREHLIGAVLKKLQSAAG